MLEYGELLIIPANGRRDLIRRLKVNQRTWGTELSNACCIVCDEYARLPSITTIPIRKSCFLVNHNVLFYENIGIMGLG